MNSITRCRVVEFFIYLVFRIVFLKNNIYLSKFNKKILQFNLKGDMV